MPNSPNRVGGTIERLDRYPEHLRAIGLIITDFGNLESNLCLLLWELLEDPVRASSIFWSLGSSKARCDIIQGLANSQYEDTEIGKEIKRVIKTVRRVSDQRNEIAHSQWGTPAINPTDPFMSIQRPATKSPVFERKWTVSELEKLADKILNAERQVDQITNALKYVRDPKFREEIDRLKSRFPNIDTYYRRFLS